MNFDVQELHFRSITAMMMVSVWHSDMPGCGVFIFHVVRDWQDRRGFSPEPRVRARAGAYLITFSTASRTAGADRCENLVIQWSLLLFFSEWIVRASCGIW